jgi:hypothetical protein
VPSGIAGVQRDLSTNVVNQVTTSSTRWLEMINHPAREGRVRCGTASVGTLPERNPCKGLGHAPAEGRARSLVAAAAAKPSGKQDF